MTTTELVRRQVLCSLPSLMVLAYTVQAAVIADTAPAASADFDFATYFYHQRAQPAPSITAQPECRWIPDPGPCHGFFRRYYYNWDSKTCEQFIYSGCDGCVPFRTNQLCEEARCDLLMPSTRPTPRPSASQMSSLNSTTGHPMRSLMTSSSWWRTSPLSMSFPTTAHSQPYSWPSAGYRVAV